MNKKKLTDKELEIYPIRDVLEGWYFRISEISPNVYRVEGVDREGRSVSRVGTELEIDALIKACSYDAQKMTN